MPLIWLISLTLGFGVNTSCPSAAALAARDHYLRGDATGAIAALANLEVCTDGSEEELADALRWRAQAKAAAGDTEGSLDAWALLWTILPTYQLDPLESPKFHDLYAQGRSRAAQRRVVFARLTKNVLGHVVVQVFDPHRRIERAFVKFDQMQMPATRQDDGSWRALVPEGASSASVVLESSEAIIFRSQKVMLTELPLPVDERIVEKPSPLPTQKVLIIGGAAAGAIVVAAIIAGIAVSVKHLDGSLGRIELP